MTARRRAAAVAVVACMLGLAACSLWPATPRDAPLPTKGFPSLSDVRDSVYQPLDRSTPPPAGYGLYTVLLTRSPERSNTPQVLAELFRTTLSSDEATMPRATLNLITLPVKNTAEARRILAPARQQPEATAAALLSGPYDYGQAARWLNSVCRPERGPAVMKTCGSSVADGPLLVTTQRPLDAATAPGERMLIVNLSNTPPEALREVLAVYRQQILRERFDVPDRMEEWRLWVLNRIIDASKLLPAVSKVYAGGK